MTFGLVRQVDGYPIIVADALLSTANPIKSAVVPSVGDTGPRRQYLYPRGSDDDDYPSAVIQKATIIADNCAATFAGPTDQAHDVFTDLKHLADRGELTKEGIDSYVQRKPTPKSLEIAGVLIEGNGRWGCFTYNATLGEDPTLGRYVLLGLGGANLDRLVGSHRMVELPPVGNPTIRQKALLSGFSTCGALLELEQRTYDTWRALSGGAYEIVLPGAGGRFEKMNHLTFVFWDVHTDGKRNRVTYPRCIFKNDYVDGILAVRALRPTKIDAAGAPIYDVFGPYIIPPMLRRVPAWERSELERQPLDLSRTYTGHFAAFSDPEHGPVVTAFVGRGKGDLNIEPNPHGYAVHVDKRIVDEVEALLNPGPGAAPLP
jgi:hypothetical protein